MNNNDPEVNSLVIDLSQFDFKKKPTLILRNPDGTAIGVLGTAYNIRLDPHYNEVSVLEFDLSAYDAVMRTPHYDQVIGLRIVDLKGIGQFVLNNPKTTNAGAWETKHCTAYSLEREFIRKNVYLEKNVYNFWNPVSSEGTVLGILMEKFPNWSVGKVDSDLIGKYRSLDDTDDNAYNVMKSTLQEAYGCIFDFDTYKRKVNVVSAASDPTSLPVYFSLDNLIRQLEIEEDDENIATCLGVYGADGLSIIDVNPMGGAKLYNFDYFMNETNFSPEAIAKYQAWKAHFKAMQEPFYNLTVEQALKESQVAAEGARLTDLQGELKALEGVQATWVELLASHDYSGKTLENGTPADEAGVQGELNKVNGQISAKKQEISAQQAVVDGAKAKADQLQTERKAIVDGCQFEAFFTEEEILQLDLYITENSIEESSFVASEIKNYNAKDTSLVVNNATASLYGSYSDNGTVSFAELPAVSQADVNAVYHIASGTDHYWDSVLTRAITPSLKKEASAIVKKETDSQSYELSAEFTAFVKTARDVYVKNAGGAVVDSSPASIRYLAKGILTVGQRTESLTAETYFLTTTDFVDGAGVVYPAGVSVAVQGTSQSKKYKVMPSDFSMTDESAITSIQRENGTIYSLSGGRLSLSAGSTTLDADVVRASVEVMTDKAFTLSAYLNSGTLGDTTFPSGTVVLTGESSSATAGSAKLTLSIKEARFYFTQNLTEWERRSVAWDLFQYGQEVLEKVSQPSYSFTVDSADFLVMDEFEAFKNALSLGKRVYLKLDNGRVLTPLLLGFSHTFDEQSGLTLEFSNKFTSNDENDRLVDLLEQSVSMGKKLDMNRETYVAFVESHANTAIDDYMNNMLNLAVKAILSEKNEVVSINENGIRLMKWLDNTHSAYDPHQIWMTHGGILFTDTAWEGTGKKPGAMMGIGHFVDDKLGEVTGVIAPNVVGSLLAGEQLYIYGKDMEGRNATFTIDNTGIHSTNMNQIWDSNTGQVAVAPEYGIIAGLKSPTGEGLFKIEEGKIVPIGTMDVIDGKPTDDRINVWIGTDGTAYFKGNIYATDGVFNGIVKATDFQTPDGKSMMTNGKFDSKYLDLGGIVIDGETGNINFTSVGSITWGGNAPVKYQFSTSLSGPWHDTMGTNDKYRRDSLDGGTTWGSAYQFKGTNGSDANVPAYIQSTYIDATKVESFQIRGNKIEALCPPTSGSSNDIGFMLTGDFNKDTLNYLQIYAEDTGDMPTTVFTSQSLCAAQWDFLETSVCGLVNFSGDVNFTGNVYGITATFA